MRREDVVDRPARDAGAPALTAWRALQAYGKGLQISHFAPTIHRPPDLE